MAKAFVSIIFVLWMALTSLAETGHDAWLRYAPMKNASSVPYEQVVALGIPKSWIRREAS